MPITQHCKLFRRRPRGRVRVRFVCFGYRGRVGPWAGGPTANLPLTRLIVVLVRTPAMYPIDRDKSTDTCPVSPGAGLSAVVLGHRIDVGHAVVVIDLDDSADEGDVGVPVGSVEHGQ
jgi:hypothetical protein